MLRNAQGISDIININKMADTKEFPEEGDLVLCTVEQILNTSVFAKLDEYNKVGILTTAEISPGRIRNIRDFVTINKKIVCKVLRVDSAKGHIDLSLRRVSLKERKSVLENYTKERGAFAILSQAVKNPEEISKKIREHGSLYDFLQSARENPELLKKAGINAEDGEKILSLTNEKMKSKKIEAKLKIKISGINDINTIRELFRTDDKKTKVSYISAPFYLIIIEGKDYKEANRKMDEMFLKVKERVKKAGGEVEKNEAAEMR